MKQFILILYVVLIATGCSKSYDDSQLWDNFNNLKGKVEKLEETCNKMNTNIASLQILIQSL